MNDDDTISTPKRVVMLVDHRGRDLMAASLLAFQLRARGVECFLEPLEAYRGALAAHRPDMMIFNHVTASHLVAWTRRLARMNVLTGVILNEGLCYNDEVRAYNAQKHHKGAHLDYFFCWNQLLKDALQHTGFDGTTIEVVGNPRHDFFFDPWSRAFADHPRPDNGRPVILLCTNFGLADFHDLPPAEADKFFAAWKERIPYLRDYRSVVATHHRYRARVLDFLGPLLASGKFNLILRPHPRERASFYEEWLSHLPESQRTLVRFDSTTNITTLIFGCDLAVGCENCNTTLESWLADKPTVELIFEKHPVFYLEEVARHSPHCTTPEDLPRMIEENLRPGAQDAYAEGRRAHLAKWCAAPAGRATARIAEVIADALTRKPAADWSQLKLSDHRRAAKLKLMHALDQPYHFNPVLGIKARISDRYKIKLKAYNKAIRPSDVERARQQLEAYYQQSLPAVPASA